LILGKKEESHNVVIDHCSLSWAVDENSAAWFPSHDITFQWCIISEALYDSYHPSGYPHSMGLLIGPETYKASIHHNLFAHNADRNPLVGGYSETEIINNVIYNWKWTATSFIHYSGTDPQYGNIIANYYKKGSNTLSDYGITLDDATSPSRFYVHDNIGPTRTSNSQDDWDIVDGGNSLRSNTETFTPSGISTQSAFTIYNSVLDNAGARPYDRDAIDQRIVQNVRYGTGELIDSQNDVGGWPNLENNYRGLTLPSNPHNDNNLDGYTNLEEWIYSFTDDTETIHIGGNMYDGNGGPISGTVSNYQTTGDVITPTGRQLTVLPDVFIFLMHRFVSNGIIKISGSQNNPTSLTSIDGSHGIKLYNGRIHLKNGGSIKIS